MTVCANRDDTPGFFTPCWRCACGEQVAAELAAAEGESAAEVAGA